MDALKNFASSSSNNNNTQQPTNNASGQGQEDYLDKGLDAVEKKYGGTWGADTNKNRAMNEKIVRIQRSSRSPHQPSIL
jgi:hypothetical protein